ncbi:MAG: hypothetical protein JJE22_14340 [Bacteroidia bacterium]|nr:hypothetical protein [Bacteroidia bacterium]
MDEGIMYTESFVAPEMNLSLVYEYVCKNTGEKTSGFACRILNKSEIPVPEEINTMLFNDLKQMAENLKTKSEALEESFFQASF